jgi:hypothetical protein
MARSIINLSLSKLTFSGLASFAQTIHDGFLALVLQYPAPNPTLLVFQTAIDDLNDAITAWGVKGNRGSHADYLALLAAANVVRNYLRMLADYAQNTKPDDSSSWTDVGFLIKRPKSAPVALEMVQNLRNFIARDIPAPSIKIKWKRPLNTDAGDVKGYIIQHNNEPVQPSMTTLPDGSNGVANVIGIVTNTTFIDSDPYVGANYYWVTPFNSLGYGVSSDMLMVISSKLAT